MTTIPQFTHIHVLRAKINVKLSKFPAITVFQIDNLEEYVLVDGFHRYYSYQEIDPTMLVNAKVYPGTVEDARWASLTVNQNHGLQRSSADKKKSISQMLLSDQGPRMSNRQIADYLNVDESTVRRLRREMESTAALPQSTERVGKDGRVIKTKNIGKDNGIKSLKNKPPTQDTCPVADGQNSTDSVGTDEQNEVDEGVSAMTFTLPVEQAANRLVEHFFTYFQKGFVNDLVIAAVEVMDEKVAPGATQRLLDELNERFGKCPISDSSSITFSGTG